MLHAFIDESGQRGHSELASPHFLLGAYVVRDKNLGHVREVLGALRTDLDKPEGGYLSWKNIRTHTARVHIAETLGAQAWFKTITVVACKNHLNPGQMTVDHMYMYHLRLLLERLSWLAKEHSETATYTLAHIKGFQVSKLREYEAKLRMMSTQIRWEHLDPAGGSIDQPKRDERLQLADLVVSAQAAAFNPDKFGNTERRYLEAASPRIYRRKAAAVSSYGLKMHPWNDNTKAAYPWVAAL